VQRKFIIYLLYRKRYIASQKTAHFQGISLSSLECLCSVYRECNLQFISTLKEHINRCVKRVDFDADVNGTGQRVCQMTSFSVIDCELWIVLT
jgi:hypothetical protein